MRPKSPSRTPGSASKRSQRAIYSSEDEEMDENVELESSGRRSDLESPDHRSDSSFNRSSPRNYGWNRNINDSPTIGWRIEEQKEFTQIKYRNTAYRIPESARTSQTMSLSSNERKSDQSESNNVIYVFCALILLLIVGYLMLSTKQQKVPVQCPEFKELHKRLTHQDLLLWKSLKVGTEGVLNKDPTKPSIFLFAYNDKRSINNIMLEIINATASCMKSKNPVQLNSDALATDAMRKDYGEVIQSYKEQLKDEGIMYVADINKVPIEAAKAFHAICDTVTPLVGRLVVFFTMHINNYHRNMSTNEILNLVEQELENNWFKEGVINDNTLKALIGRITDQVFLLHSEHLVQ